MLSKRKKRRKKKRVNRVDSGSNFFLAIIFAVMFVIVFTFHLFLSSTIDGLISEQGRIEKEFNNIELEIKDSESDFSNLFQLNRDSIAHAFYNGKGIRSNIERPNWKGR